MISDLDCQDISKARLIYPGDRVYHYDDQKLAYAIYLESPKGVRIAFRGAGDKTPVYNHDYRDRL